MPRIRSGSTVGRRSFLLGGLATLGGGAALTSKWLASGFDWDNQPRLFGLSMAGSSPVSVPDVEAAGAALGRRLQVINFYMAWEWRDPFPAATVAAIRDAGAVPEITWEPWDPKSGADQPAYRLDALSAFDDYVDTFARGCADYGGNLVLRFAHEMNSDWYPWSVTTNGGSPQEYIAAYRRVRSRFEAAGAHNVQWMWNPNVIVRDRPDLISASYPGDDVVDIVGVDGYNRGGRSPQDLFGASVDLLHGLAPDKALWIDEVGCKPMPDKAQWVSDFFEYVRGTPVSAVVWFELDSPGAPDWKLLSTADTAEAARRALAEW
jgi:mannan endo-1,4-beta-mannosidase